MKDASAHPRDGGRKGPEKAFCLKAGLGRTPRRRKGFMLARKMRGFSLIEMMIVIAMILIVLAFSIMAIQPSLKQNNVTEAFNQTLMALRQARDLSVAQRQIYFVTLSNTAVPNSITITQGSTGTLMNTYYLPSNVSFDVEGGIPTSQTTFPMTPDSFGI